MLELFATREAYETFIDQADVTPDERAYIETLLPAHLQPQGTV